MFVVCVYAERTKDGHVSAQYMIYSDPSPVLKIEANMVIVTLDRCAASDTWPHLSVFLFREDQYWKN